MLAGGYPVPAYTGFTGVFLVIYDHSAFSVCRVECPEKNYQKATENQRDWLYMIDGIGSTEDHGMDSRGPVDQSQRTVEHAAFLLADSNLKSLMKPEFVCLAKYSGNFIQDRRKSSWGRSVVLLPLDQTGRTVEPQSDQAHHNQ